MRPIAASTRLRPGSARKIDSMRLKGRRRLSTGTQEGGWPHRALVLKGERSSLGLLPSNGKHQTNSSRRAIFRQSHGSRTVHSRTNKREVYARWRGWALAKMQGDSGRPVLSRNQRLRTRPSRIFSPLDWNSAIIAHRAEAVRALHDRGQHGAMTAKDTAQAHADIDKW